MTLLRVLRLVRVEDIGITFRKRIRGTEKKEPLRRQGKDEEETWGEG